MYPNMSALSNKFQMKVKEARDTVRDGFSYLYKLTETCAFRESCHWEARVSLIES